MIRKANILDISALIFMLNSMHKETELKIPKINTFILTNKINEIFI